MSVPSKYQVFLQYFLLNVRIIHIASIIFWVVIGLKLLINSQYKTYLNCNSTQEYVDQLESKIVKKDLEENALKKDLKENRIKNDFHEGHRWKPYQKFLIFFVSIESVSISYIMFSLQLKECQPFAQILKGVLNL